MNIGNTLNLTGEIYRRTGAVNTLGEKTDTWERIGEADCSMHVGQERDRRDDCGLLNLPFFVAFFYDTADLVAEDQFRRNGVTYRVAFVADPHFRELHKIAIIQAGVGDAVGN